MICCGSGVELSGVVVICLVCLAHRFGGTQVSQKPPSRSIGLLLYLIVPRSAWQEIRSLMSNDGDRKIYAAIQSEADMKWTFRDLRLGPEPELSSLPSPS